MRGTRTKLLTVGLTVILLSGFAAAAHAIVAEMNLDIAFSDKEAIPPDGAVWHELAPAFCNPWIQDDYFDNDGDGQISVCDQMNMTGPDGTQGSWHIVWVGPTIWIDWDGDGQWTDEGLDFIVEPIESDDWDLQICEFLREVYPDPGYEWHIDYYEDFEQPGVISPCDWLWLDGFAEGFHIIDVTFDVIVAGPGPVPNEDSTWSDVKQLYD